jgi:uncharacterized cofD-like protein
MDEGVMVVIDLLDPKSKDITHSLKNLVYVAAVEYERRNRGAGADRQIAEQRAIHNLNILLCPKHKVIPVTTDHAALYAEFYDGPLAFQEHVIDSGIGFALTGISSIQVTPCKLYDEARHALQDADAITFGPGSYFTSVIAPTLVPGFSNAIRSRKIIYIANLTTVPGETSFINPHGITLNFSLNTHVDLLEAAIRHQVTHVVRAPPLGLIINDTENTFWSGSPYLPLKATIPGTMVLTGDIGIFRSDLYIHDAQKTAVLINEAITN